MEIGTALYDSDDPSSLSDELARFLFIPFLTNLVKDLLKKPNESSLFCWVRVILLTTFIVVGAPYFDEISL